MSKDRILTFIPVANAYGSFKAIFWLSNKEGLTDSQEVTIELTPVNDAPKINQPPDLVVHYDKPYGFDYTAYISDIDNALEDLTLTAKESDGSQHTTVSGLSVVYNFPEDYNMKQVIVTLTVSDGVDIAKNAITVEITDDSPPEVLKPLPDVTMYEGETKTDVFKLDEYFADPDKDLIYFSSRTEHLTITIQTDSFVDIAADSDWSGDEFVTFRATDGKGALVEDTIIVHVLPFNNPPEIGDVPDLMVRYDSPYYFDLWPYITDIDTPLEELTIVSDDPYLNISDYSHLTIALNYPKSMMGETIPLVLMVSDGESVASKTIQVTVSDNWPPERRYLIPDITIYEDQNVLGKINLKDYFFDRDQDEIYFSYGQKKVEVIIHDNGSVDFFPSENWYGTEHVTFRAEDSKGALVEDTVKVTVVPVNDPPSILPLPDQSGEAGTMWKLDLLPYLEDIDTNVTTLEIWTNSGDHEELDVVVAGTELVFFGTGEFQGTVTIFASDGDNEVQTEINVTVTPAAVQPQEDDATAMYLLIVLLVVIVLVIIILLLVFKRVYLGTYKIEEAFIVDKHGMCLAHRSRRVDSDVDTDEDIFSGMLTVIQQFVKDSFKTKDDKEEEEYLNMFKYGDTTVFIEQGKRIFVAVFFKGTPGKTLDKKVERFLTNLEKKHEKTIRTWAGDMKSIAILGEKLGEFMGVKGKVDMDTAMMKATVQPLDTGERKEPPRRQVEVPMEKESVDKGGRSTGTGRHCTRGTS
jgi:hypothetical protein